jgi:membrane protease subunit HflC
MTMAGKSNRSMATILLGTAVVAAFVLYMILFTVQFTETAVVLQWSKVKQVIGGDQAGCYVKAPWPVERVVKFDNRLVVHESKLEQLLTADEGSVTVMVNTAWRISEKKEDVVNFYNQIKNRLNAGTLLTSLSHDAMGKIVGRYRFDEFVSTDPAVMKFDQIENELLKEIAEKALKSYGIEIRTVSIRRLELPEDATKKAFERMRYERLQLADKYRAEGEEKARKIRSDADLAVSDIRNRAEADAIRIRGEGDAEAAEYYKVFAAEPQLHNFIKRLEALKKMLPQRTTLVLDADTVPPFDLMKSSLMEWLDRQGAGEKK